MVVADQVMHYGCLLKCTSYIQTSNVNVPGDVKGGTGSSSTLLLVSSRQVIYMYEVKRDDRTLNVNIKLFLHHNTNVYLALKCYGVGKSGLKLER